MANEEFKLERKKHLQRLLPRILTVFGVIAALHFWLGWSVQSSSQIPDAAKAFVWILLVSGYILLPFGFFSNQAESRWLPGWIPYFSFAWLGIFWIWLSTQLFFLIVVGPLFLLFGWTPLPGGSILVAGILSAWALWTGFRPPRIHEIKVALPDWPSELDGFKIVQLSDIHTGMLFVNDKFLEKIVRRTNALKPDLVALTGDLVEGPPTRVRALVQPLSQIQARHGRFFVTGNHEYYYGGRVWEQVVQDLGWTVLSNRHEVINIDSTKLAIVGVTDSMAAAMENGSKSDPAKAFRGLDEKIPRIFLAHQPRSLLEALPARFDLQLSGHTHGGQIFPFNFLVHTQQPTNRGLQKIKDRWIFTHMGTGFWGPPMRLGTHSEIAVLIISRAGVAAAR